VILFQDRTRSDAHRRGYEDRRPHRERPLRRHRPPEVAVRRLVGRRLPRKQDGIGRTSGVKQILDCERLLRKKITNLLLQRYLGGFFGLSKYQSLYKRQFYTNSSYDAKNKRPPL
jgi:hypothetical protein